MMATGEEMRASRDATFDAPGERLTGAAERFTSGYVWQRALDDFVTWSLSFRNILLIPSRSEIARTTGEALPSQYPVLLSYSALEGLCGGLGRITGAAGLADGSS